MKTEMMAAGAFALAIMLAFPASAAREQCGTASWYGPGFDGNLTASGERFNQYAMTAAHPTLPFGTVVTVERADGAGSVRVRINDRGPFAGGRIIDLSRGAAQQLGMINAGVMPVRLSIDGVNIALPGGC